MNSFIALARQRAHVGAWALVVILVVLLLQNSLSDSIAISELTPSQIDRALSDELQYLGWQIIKLVVFVPAVLFWLLDRRKELRTALLLGNFLLTFELFSSVILLILTIGDTHRAQLATLIRDTVVVMVINILNFSLWYWLIDVPGMREKTGHERDRWDFMFPQRAAAIPGYEKWSPRFPDYLFLALVTTTTFGPADTYPISTRAKLLMGMQVVNAFATLTVLAGRALTLIGS
ncbi:MAG: hypothetical protein HY741_13640 [Chloroflexi bacterium]|nr:hypothetical protein [Chloroflexota bacterium]